MLVPGSVLSARSLERDANSRTPEERRAYSVLMQRWVFGMLAAVCVALVLSGLAGVVLCEGALHPARRPVSPDPEARTVPITADDGIPLRAWLFKPGKPNGAAVVLLHGIADSRSSQVGLARMLVLHGYSVLAPDSRAHGESGGNLATYGLRESGDVHRWVSWLMDTQHPRCVYGIGESLGGAVLIQSLEVEHRFSAIVAESAFSSFERIARDRIAERLPVPPGFGRFLAATPVWGGFAYARWRYGLDFRDASAERALAKSITPVLLIHGLNDRETPPQHSKILAASNPNVVTLWLVPGAGHTGAFGIAPREFKKRVLEFFRTHPGRCLGINQIPAVVAQ